MKGLIWSLPFHCEEAAEGNSGLEASLMKLYHVCHEIRGESVD
jgi:hypothetical protein